MFVILLDLLVFFRRFFIQFRKFWGSDWHFWVAFISLRFVILNFQRALVRFVCSSWSFYFVISKGFSFLCSNSLVSWSILKGFLADSVFFYSWFRISEFKGFLEETARVCCLNAIQRDFGFLWFDWNSLGLQKFQRFWQGVVFMILVIWAIFV